MKAYSSAYWKRPGAAVAGKDKSIVFSGMPPIGAMDYLTEVPQDISRSIPDSLDSYTERADQVTGLLANILQQQPPPPILLT